MKFILVISIVLTASLYGTSFAHEHSSDHGADDSSDQQKHASEHKLGKHHHRRHGHHRNKIHKMMMSKADSNNDGKVDLNEYLQNAQQRFESMDADSDGYVTGEEMREASKTMRKKHKEAMKAARKSYQDSVDKSK